MPRDPRSQHRRRVVAGRDRQIGPCRQIRQWPGCEHAPVPYQGERVGEARDLIERVGHVQDRQVERLLKPGEIGQDLRLALGVEARQRLVHNEQPRLRQQRPPDGDTLPLAPGERVRPPFEQGAEAEQINDSRDPERTRGYTTKAVAKVPQHRKMREQARVLEYDPNSPAFGRQEDAALGIGEDAPVHDDPALCRPKQSRQHGGNRRFAASGGAEQSDRAGRGRFERDVKGCAGESVVERDLEAHRPMAARSLRPARSARMRPNTASMTDTSESRAATASPPGVCSAA